MTYCAKCGAEIFSEDSACPKCGKKVSSYAPGSSTGVSNKSRTATLLFAIFLGIFGVHRFYTGKFWTGILQLILSSTGIGEIWWIIDIILIACGEFKDSNGDKILVW